MSYHKLPRLFLNQAFNGNAILLDQDQWHYCRNVMRLEQDDEIMVFNGQDGEWLGKIIVQNKKKYFIEPIKQIEPQKKPSNIHLIFAPLKKPKLDYIVQKAVELGAASLTPVLTDYTDNHKLKMDKIELQIIEACEQSTQTAIPELRAPIKLAAMLEQFNEKNALIFCDERCDEQNPITALDKISADQYYCLIGPEGGFSDEEGALIKKHAFASTISLGKLILRAETAAISALTLIQATKGDWR